MDALGSVVLVVFLSIPMGLAAAAFAARGPVWMQGLFGPLRRDGWPPGVQEEDPSFERSWRLGPTAALPLRPDREPEVADPEPVVERVVARPLRRG